MYYTGFADEAGADLDTQIKATKELGWKFIETRVLMGSNLAFIDDAAFDEVCREIDEAGVKFNCFGSGVANWAKSITDSPEESYEELRRAIPRMQKLGTEFIRIMSFPVKDIDNYESYGEEAFKRLRTIAKMAEDGGVTCVLENCSGWAAGSFEHTLRTLEAVNSPALKLVFDTGNPVFHDDIRGKSPFKKQDSWEFYNAVKDFIAYVHIKDGYMKDGKEVFTFPGDGDGCVLKIVKDLLENGYDGGFSIEPHMAVVFHDESVKSEADIRYNNYVEYGKRFMEIVKNIA